MSFDSKKNPFGNYDEPMPPISYRPKIKSRLIRKILWTFRNPLHNFMNYWIGYRGEVNATLGKFLGPGRHTSFIQVIRNQERIWKRCYSYRGDKWEWYIGWRPSGAFGMALRVANSKDASEVE